MSFTEKSMVLFLAVVLASGCSQTSWYSRRPMDYPTAHKSDVTDAYHGMQVADPYRWLENSDSGRTRAWIRAQNELTSSWLNEIPVRDKIRNRMIRLWNHEKYGLPVKRGERCFFSHKDGSQRQSVVYWTESLDGDPKVLLDPNTLSKNGKSTLSGYSISRDGQWMAYGLSNGAPDRTDWYVRNVDTGRDLFDHLRCGARPNVSWDKEGEGFYYSRSKVLSSNGKLSGQEYCDRLYYHRLGKSQSDDELIYGRFVRKDRRCSGIVTDDGRYLIVTVHKDAEPENLIYYKRLGTRNGCLNGLITEFDSRFRFIDNDGPIFWFFTDRNAPLGRVVAVDVRNPSEECWRTIIPETDQVLQEVDIVNDTLIASYLRDACSRIKLFDINGRFLRELELPGLGTVRGLEGNRFDKGAFYRFESFTNPGTIYRCDLDTGRSEIYRRPKLDFDPDRFVTKQAFCTSKDGTRVSMFITHKKGLRLDGRNHAMLVAYGGFNAAMTPYFAAT